MENKDICYSIAVFWTIPSNTFYSKREILVYLDYFLMGYCLKSHILLGEVDLISPSSLIPFHMVLPSHETSLNWSFMRAEKKADCTFFKKRAKQWKKISTALCVCSKKDSVVYRNAQGTNYPCIFCPLDLTLL